MMRLFSLIFVTATNQKRLQKQTISESNLNSMILFQKYSIVFSYIPPDGREFTVYVGYGYNYCRIASLEHVVLHIDATYCVRGFLKAEVWSPAQTSSIIFPGRINDRRTDEVDWSAMSVHFWSESAIGIWTVKLSNMNYEQSQDCIGNIAPSNSVESTRFQIKHSSNS